jgi:esterase/lipase
MAALNTICQTLLAAEETLFAEEYAQHHLAGESKHSDIGKPFLLHNPAARSGILLVHGLMAAPEEVRQWADYLFAQGYTVYAPRMAGHGTSAVDLNSRRHSEWSASVQRGYAILQNCCDEVIAAGFSTGAAIMLQQVIEHPHQFRALISISAPVRFSKFSAHFARPVHRLNRVLQGIGLRQFAKPFVTNHADNPHINYLRCPVASIVQIKRLMKNVLPALHRIQIPALIMHASHDPKVHVQSARDIYRHISSPQKEYVEVDFALHGIIRGEISQQVFAHVTAFLQTLNLPNANQPH